MNEELKELILRTLSETKTFVLEQSPEVIQQFLSFELVSSCICLVLSFSAAAAVVYGFIKSYRLTKSEDYNTSEIGTFGVCFCSVGFAVNVFICFLNLNTIIHVYFFPKAYLLYKFLS